MDSIWVKKVRDSRIDRNSMFEEDLISSSALSGFYATPRAAQIQSGTDTKIPDYLDRNIDITTSPLYKYLN